MIGNIATVLAPIPVTLSRSHNKTVQIKVTETTTERQLRCTLPSICNSIVFCLNGKKVLRRYQPINKSTMVRGIINSNQSPKPIPALRPFTSFRYLRAIALGGVPMGVPIPPMLAATGIPRVKAIRPLPSGGRALKTGVKNVRVIIAVAVFDRNIEKTPVIKMNPNSTFSDLFPNGFNKVLASNTSRPALLAAIARMKPPKKRIIIGSANVAIISS